MKSVVAVVLATLVAGCVAVPFGECPPVDGATRTYLPDTIQRSVFWMCSRGQAVMLACPAGRVHNPNLNNCVVPSADATPFGPIGKCEVYSRSFFRDGLNVAVFWQCKNGEAIMHRCTDNMWFEPDFGGACFKPEYAS